MRTAIDTSVLLDVLLEDPKFATSSHRALLAARANGSLVASEVVVAELGPILSGNKIEEFFNDLGISFVPSNFKSASLAGEIMSKYLSRGGAKKRVVPDFLIGAHAQVHSDQLLARDRGFYRDYFTKLKVYYN